MHAEALAYVKAQTAGQSFGLVYDIGGRDINGSVRPHVEADEYLSVDLYAGRGVDVVADVTGWKPPARADLVVCCEVLEHAPDPRAVVEACLRLLRKGGTLILTCAGPGRAPHSAHDGAAVRDGEHYANVDPADLADWLPGAAVQHHPGRGDVYATATKG